jgi:hypothetical protein
LRTEQDIVALSPINLIGSGSARQEVVTVSTVYIIEYLEFCGIVGVISVKIRHNLPPRNESRPSPGISADTVVETVLRKYYSAESLSERRED